MGVGLDDARLIGEGRLPQRLSMTTLGVGDVPRALAFYEALGFIAAGFESADVCFFDMGGTVLGLYGREALAADAGVGDAGSGFQAVTCALNVDSTSAVDGALALAQSVGARIVKPAKHVFWGGYSGYFADLDGHLWEIAYNPVFQLDAAGRVQLPVPASTAGGAA